MSIGYVASRGKRRNFTTAKGLAGKLLHAGSSETVRRQIIGHISFDISHMSLKERSLDFGLWTLDLDVVVATRIERPKTQDQSPKTI